VKSPAVSNPRPRYQNRRPTDEEEDYFLQRSETGDRRLQQKDLLRYLAKQTIQQTVVCIQIGVVILTFTNDTIPGGHSRDASWDSWATGTGGAGNFSLHHPVQPGSGAHPASYPMGTRGPFPGGKAAEA
jgi:hypothetical protein